MFDQSIGRPSASRRERRVGALALAADVLFEVRTELLQEAERGHRRPLAERADRVPHDVVRDVVQVLELVHRGLAVEDLLERPVEPGRALAAWRELPPRLEAEERDEVR